MSEKLTDLEIEILNKIIPTQTISEPQHLQQALRNLIGEEQAAIMARENMSEADFKTMQVQSAKNIFQFLKHNAFISEREGGVIFLTDKGKHLKKQRTIQQYYQWQKERRDENKTVINTIETRGYLDQDQIQHNGPMRMYKLKKYVLYPLLVIFIILVVVAAAHHFKLF